MGLALDPAAEARFAAWEARVRELGDDLAEPGLPDDLAEAWDVPPLAPPPPNQVAKEQRRAAAAARAGRYQLLSDEDESDHGSDFDANAADVDAEMVGEDGEDLVDYGTGDWVEHLVMQDRTQKITKSGQIMSYRTLVTVGNANGTGGFGMGKGAEPQQSVVRAFRDARRSLIYVERYKMSGLLYPLYGEHNNLKVYIYPTRPGSGLRAGDIIEGILEGFGIADATAKAYGKRHPYSVVRATFNALLGHEGLHDVAMRRGARILSVHKTLLGRHHRDDPRYY
ncbi:ribosomal protein S5, C-terminal domain-containing protein [Tribonema minus]|uniref:Ribosomal protein S5, C-terminal domain-containing protein n=1 Tax=Tribonema minus TaxID=303371 RepID=A0A835ZCM9_9STRA|nr:ribosomal protein S5, C-terminal domain-containing protein [Tribonema minus]